MTKLFMFISAFIMFVLMPGQALAGKITFKIENEKGVPQPIEVRQQFNDGDLTLSGSGFGQITLDWIYPGDVFYISRHYQGMGPNAPEGKGFRYVYSNSSPTEVTITAPSIKSKFLPLPVSDLSRGILGEINRRREEAGIPKAPGHPYLNEAASIWTQELEGGVSQLETIFRNQQLLWNYNFGVKIESIMGVWLPDLDYYLSYKTCNNSDIKCMDRFLDPKVEYIGVATLGQAAYIFSAIGCKFNCELAPDFGDPELLKSPICVDCGTNKSKNPNFKIKYFKKNRKGILAKASCRSDAVGKARLFISHRKNKIRVVGSRTKDGFIFKVSLSQLKKRKISLSGKIKTVAYFSGNQDWQSKKIRIS